MRALSVHILRDRAFCTTSCTSSLRLAGFQDLIVVVSPTGVWFVAMAGVWGLVQDLGFGLVGVWFGADVGFRGLKCGEGKVLDGSLHKLCLASSPSPSSLR
jgi:hypothetical protein